MAKLTNATTQCKCQNLSPLRTARAEALIAYLHDQGGALIYWAFYNTLRTQFDWTRSISDQALNDVVSLGRARFVQGHGGIEIELLPEEAPCLA